MTEKELHKLRKQDLLQLLLAQGREAAELQEQITKLSASLEETEAGNERLKAKLDEKDELIEKLKSRLDEKDARITKMREIMKTWRANRQIELEEAGSIAADRRYGDWIKKTKGKSLICSMQNLPIYRAM